MRRPETLPLGIDIGGARVRACAVARIDGRPRIIAVGCCNIRKGDVAAAIRGAVDALDTRERRCVIAVRPPEATLRRMTFPPMSENERLRAARFDMRRDAADGESFVTRIRPLDEPDAFACGAIGRERLLERTALCRRAGVKPVAVDYEPFAWRRAAPTCDAVLDVGLHASRLMVFGADVPDVASIAIGGDAFTQALATAIGLGVERAEERKRAIGIGTSGAAERRRLTTDVFDALTTIRSRGVANVRTLLLGGNGSRLASLAESLAEALGCDVVRDDRTLAADSAYPPDVLRAASADWNAAIGLALYGAAA
jgi:Tfp pilus assembly PilM family ATPase